MVYLWEESEKEDDFEGEENQQEEWEEGEGGQ